MPAFRVIGRQLGQPLPCQLKLQAGVEEEFHRHLLRVVGQPVEVKAEMSGLVVSDVHGLRNRLDEVNALNKEELKEYYKKVLNNGEMSLKGGGGLGMIDIARKTGEKLDYNFLEIDNKVSFFTLNIKVSQIPQQ